MPNFHIYEVRNETLKEAYVAASPFHLSAFQTEFHQNPPDSTRHWRLGQHQIAYIEVERDLPEADARHFLKQYLKSSMPLGWRLIQEDGAGSAAALTPKKR